MTETSETPTKAVLITGCSTGIGRATAEHLAGTGWNVYATARRTESIEDLREKGCKTLPLDVTDEASMRDAVQAVEAAEGAVGVLVNNAGYSQSGAVESVQIADIRAQFETNVFGLVRMCQLVLPGMRRQHWGKIVNVSSMGGKLTFPGGGIYHGTKHAVEAISDALRFEVREFGVDVIVIEPGLIRTQFADAAVNAIDSGTTANGPVRGVQRSRGGGHGRRVRRALRQARRRPRRRGPQDRQGDLAAAAEGALSGHAVGAHDPRDPRRAPRPRLGRVRGHQLSTSEAMTRPPSVAIVGAGFGGIGTAVSLRRSGIEDVTVLERGERVGGVWNQNTYPGAACDVPSHLYSYSFAPNPRWGRRFAAQPEIQRYVEDVARRHGVLDRVRLDTDVRSATWDAGVGRLAARDRRRSRRGRHARLRLRAARPARRSRTVDGLDRFAGPVFHSSQWRHDVDLRGLRVGVLGSGASAIQFVPAIQPLVRSMTVVQRSPPWILPKPDRAYRPFDTSHVRAPAGRTGRGPVRLVGLPGGGHRGVHRARRGDAPARRDLARAPSPPGARPGAAPAAHPDLQDGLQAGADLDTTGIPRSPRRTSTSSPTAIDHATETGLVLRGRARGRTRRADLRHRLPHPRVRRADGHRRAATVARSTRSGRRCRMPGTASPCPAFPNMFLIYGPNTFGGSGSGDLHDREPDPPRGGGGRGAASHRRARDRGARARRTSGS